MTKAIVFTKVVYKRGQVWIDGRLASSDEVATLEAQRKAPTPTQTIRPPQLSLADIRWMRSNLS